MPATRRKPVLPALLFAVLLAACGTAQPWHLHDVRHILPDLQFQGLRRADGGDAAAADFRGKLVLMYFGYTHCPDVCQVTMALLSGVLRQLGPQAADVRILFVAVDPARDTPAAVERYLRLFDAVHSVGLLPQPQQLAALARRYRVSYSAAPADAQGRYDVSHSSGVFVFDRRGHARLLGTDTLPPSYFVEDLERLLAERGGS